MKVQNYMEELATEKTPKWLDNYNPWGSICLDDFFNSRVVYYPGAEYDTHAVEVFGMSRSAHCFVHLDYLRYFSKPKDASYGLVPKILRKFHFDVIGKQEFDLTDSMLNIKDKHFSDSQEQEALNWYRSFHIDQSRCRGAIYILEQNEDWSRYSVRDQAMRLAIMVLNRDGHLAYDALFCQSEQRPPFAVLLQNHGMGGNYSSFGEDGILHSIASAANSWPQYLLCAMNTDPWNGYKKVEGVEPTFGGWADFERYLYVRDA